MEDYVSYDQAVKLKELGFDWETYAHYHFDKIDGLPDKYPDVTFDNYNCSSLEMYSAPTLSQAQKWLREVKQIIIIPCVMYVKDILKYDFYIDGESLVVEYDFEGFDTYEQALSAGIDKAIEILKEQNNGK